MDSLDTVVAHVVLLDGACRFALNSYCHCVRRQSRQLSMFFEENSMLKVDGEIDQDAA